MATLVRAGGSVLEEICGVVVVGDASYFHFLLFFGGGARPGKHNIKGAKQLKWEDQTCILPTHFAKYLSFYGYAASEKELSLHSVV